VRPYSCSRFSERFPHRQVLVISGQRGWGEGAMIRIAVTAAAFEAIAAMY
jgi:hypothetical protein